MRAPRGAWRRPGGPGHRRRAGRPAGTEGMRGSQQDACPRRAQLAKPSCHARPGPEGFRGGWLAASAHHDRGEWLAPAGESTRDNAPAVWPCERQKRASGGRDGRRSVRHFTRGGVSPRKEIRQHGGERLRARVVPLALQDTQPRCIAAPSARRVAHEGVASAAGPGVCERPARATGNAATVTFTGEGMDRCTAGSPRSPEMIAGYCPTTRTKPASRHAAQRPGPDRGRVSPAPRPTGCRGGPMGSSHGARSGHDRRRQRCGGARIVGAGHSVERPARCRPSALAGARVGSACRR